MNIKTAYVWERGERKSNQDSLVLECVETRAGNVIMAAVCDGVGGLAEGEVASGFVAEMLVVWFYKEFLVMFQKKKSTKKLKKSAFRLAYEVDETLKNYSKRKSIRLGTTLTMLLVTECNYFVLHVGDSRAYKARRKLKILTKDNGEGDRLYRCIGAGKWEKPQWLQGRAKKGTAFFVCTDGIYKKLSEDEIKTLMHCKCVDEKELQKRLQEAMRIIRSRTMNDNASAITVVI